MNKLLHLATLITKTILINFGHSEAKTQSQTLKSTQNSQKQTWVAIYNKSSFTIAASLTELEHNRVIIVSPKSTQTPQTHFAQVTEDTLMRFIELNLNDPNAYFYWGLLRTQERDYQGAEADYTQLIRLKPNEAYVYNNRGLIRKELKNYKGAEADFT